MSTLFSRRADSLPVPQRLDEVQLARQLMAQLVARVAHL